MKFHGYLSRFLLGWGDYRTNPRLEIAGPICNSSRTWGTHVAAFYFQAEEFVRRIDRFISNRN
ncbi:MAG: hypothetical protein OIF35_12880 [Cellvibrionaceae bacterium]|nr:hypothetical protein [Cellvibrionaceae bacterium]